MVVSRLWSADCVLYPPEPAPLHHFITPSSPPVTKAPELPLDDGLGLQETAHTLSVSWIVETAARAPISQILMLLSADLYYFIDLAVIASCSKMELSIDLP